MTQQKLRWGILGTAKINERVLPGFAKATNADLQAIASRSLEKAKNAAQAANIPNAFGSYDELLADSNIDAVYIPLPNTLHAEYTKKAADHGKHILCEKPLSPTADEAQEVVDYCAEKGMTLLDGFMWPHHPRTARLRKFLDDGEIGDVQRVTASFTFKMAVLDPANIRLQSELGGGSLLDVGCYPIYGIRWAFGAEPMRVQAAARYEHDVDVEMNGMMWFDDGRVATFDCGFLHPYRGWMEITGTDGVVFVSDMWLPPKKATFLVHRGQHIVPETVTIDGEDQIQHMIQNLGRAVMNGDDCLPPPSEAVKSLRVLDGLAKSAREEQQVVALPGS